MPRIFTYWEGDNPPTYIQLAVATWYEFIPNLNVTVLNHSNLEEWIGSYVDLNALKTYSLAMQSDVVSAVILAKYGGVFMDADTIVTRDVTSFIQSEDKRLTAFGKPIEGQFHVAVLRAGPRNGAAVRWANEATRRVNSTKDNPPWNYLAGSILEAMTMEPETKALFNIIDRTESGNILEAKFGTGYKEFYFSETDQCDPDLAIASATEGIISLHNSWTPKEYSDIQDPIDVLAHKSFLSRILHTLLGEGFESRLSLLTEKSWGLVK